MLSSQHHCLILSVGPIKETKGFKKCFVRIKTKELSGDGEVIRQSGLYDAEVALKSDDQHKQLQDIAKIHSGAYTSEDWLPCFFIWRAFEYTEKAEPKLGKQLQLKRWWK